MVIDANSSIRYPYYGKISKKYKLQKKQLYGSEDCLKKGKGLKQPNDNSQGSSISSLFTAVVHFPYSTVGREDIFFHSVFMSFGHLDFGPLVITHSVFWQFGFFKFGLFKFQYFSHFFAFGYDDNENSAPTRYTWPHLLIFVWCNAIQCR